TEETDRLGAFPSFLFLVFCLRHRLQHLLDVLCGQTPPKVPEAAPRRQRQLVLSKITARMGTATGRSWPPTRPATPAPRPAAASGPEPLGPRRRPPRPRRRTPCASPLGPPGPGRHRPAER